jgi:hypothetical protein
MLSIAQPNANNIVHFPAIKQPEIFVVVPPKTEPGNIIVRDDSLKAYGIEQGDFVIFDTAQRSLLGDLAAYRDSDGSITIADEPVGEFVGTVIAIQRPYRRAA